MKQQKIALNLWILQNKHITCEIIIVCWFIPILFLTLDGCLWIEKPDAMDGTNYIRQKS